MKTSIACHLMTEEQAQALRLKGQPYLIAIDKSLFAKHGITDPDLKFELTLNDNKLILIGPTIEARPRDKPLTTEVIT